MHHQAFADLLGDGVQRVQAGHRLLENHADACTAHFMSVCFDAPIISSPSNWIEPVGWDASG